MKTFVMLMLSSCIGGIMVWAFLVALGDSPEPQVEAKPEIVCLGSIENWPFLIIQGQPYPYMPEDLFRQLAPYYEVKFDKVVFWAPQSRVQFVEARKKEAGFEAGSLESGRIQGVSKNGQAPSQDKAPEEKPSKEEVEVQGNRSKQLREYPNPSRASGDDPRTQISPDKEVED